MVVDQIRASAGTAAVLGLRALKMKTAPTTAYLMLYTDRRCGANCGFCPQARDSTSDLAQLSRISWPPFPLEELIAKLPRAVEQGLLNRVCIQTLNYPGMLGDVLEIVSKIRTLSEVNISIAISPLTKKQFQELRVAGVERVGIALDACTPDLFYEVKGKGHKGPYDWARHLQALEDALTVFGRGFVSTHFIVGLGETERDLLLQIQKVVDLGIVPSLFAFTPVKGTRLEDRDPPALPRYRKMQLGRFLIITRNREAESFTFDENGVLIDFHLTPTDLEEIIVLGDPFKTQGCPDCNRPFYTSKPVGPQYNYPRALTEDEKREIFDLLVPYAAHSQGE